MQTYFLLTTKMRFKIQLTYLLFTRFYNNKNNWLILTFIPSTILTSIRVDLAILSSSRKQQYSTLNYFTRLDPLNTNMPSECLAFLWPLLNSSQRLNSLDCTFLYFCFWILCSFFSETRQVCSDVNRDSL